MLQLKFFISVAEPWNFNSPDGPNVINGAILETLNPQCLLFKAKHRLQIRGRSGDLLVLKPRHADHDFNDLIHGKGYVMINGSLIPAYEACMDERSIQQLAVFAIAGSIRAKRRWNP